MNIYTLDKPRCDMQTVYDTVDRVVADVLRGRSSVQMLAWEKRR
ncbi:MAG: hypothetical protein ACI8WL_001768 [Polaribacter sp.]|jgi:hypothetical protein